MTGATDIATIADGGLRLSVIQMYAPQPELIPQVEMVVYGDSAIVLVGYERQQPLRVDRLRAGLVQMQVVKTHLEERGQYLVLLHEERGLSHDDELHTLAFFFSRAKVLKRSEKCEAKREKNVVTGQILTFGGRIR